GVPPPGNDVGVGLAAGCWLPVGAAPKSPNVGRAKTMIPATTRTASTMPARRWFQARLPRPTGAFGPPGPPAPVTGLGPLGAGSIFDSAIALSHCSGVGVRWLQSVPATNGAGGVVTSGGGGLTSGPGSVLPVLMGETVCAGEGAMSIFESATWPLPKAGGPNPLSFALNQSL